VLRPEKVKQRVVRVRNECVDNFNRPYVICRSVLITPEETTGRIENRVEYMAAIYKTRFTYGTVRVKRRRSYTGNVLFVYPRTWRTKRRRKQIIRFRCRFGIRRTLINSLLPNAVVLFLSYTTTIIVTHFCFVIALARLCLYRR